GISALVRKSTTSFLDKFIKAVTKRWPGSDAAV
ncbi:hypothetical protein, partial [Idiomarina abyssalis]